MYLSVFKGQIMSEGKFGVSKSYEKQTRFGIMMCLIFFYLTHFRLGKKSLFAFLGDLKTPKLPAETILPLIYNILHKNIPIKST